MGLVISEILDFPSKGVFLFIIIIIIIIIIVIKIMYLCKEF